MLSPGSGGGSPEVVLLQENTRLKMENIQLKEENKQLLQEKIQNLEQFKSQSEQVKALEAQESKMQKQLDQLVRENEDLKAENAKLKEENAKLSARVAQLEQKNQALELREQKSQALLDAYDLSRMFVYYFVAPQLGNIQSWNTLSDELSQQMAALQDRDITQRDLDEWLSSKPESGLLVPILELNQQHHGIAHKDIRSKTNQEAFLQHVKSRDFKNLLPKHASVLAAIIPRLAAVPKKRMNYQ